MPENIYGTVSDKKPAASNSGNDLLDAILNKRLKSVKQPDPRERASFSAHRTDVAAILMRRMAVELSDSEESNDDGDEWSDDGDEED